MPLLIPSLTTMPHILFNLSSQYCPDYTLGVLELAQIPLVNNTMTHEQATVLLTNFWNTSNATKKLLWQVQVDADEADAKAVQQLQAEEKALRAAESQKEQDDIHQEEHRANSCPSLISLYCYDSYRLFTDFLFT